MKKTNHKIIIFWTKNCQRMTQIFENEILSQKIYIYFKSLKTNRILFFAKVSPYLF
jgi:hypothetical protein